MKKYIISLVFILLAITLANTSLAAKGIIKIGNAGGSSGITAVDLGIENPGTLPNSPFYFFKEWGRGISRAFTFGATAKAELELKITNEKAAELLEVEKTKPDDSLAITKALENYTAAQEQLKNRLSSLKETSKNPNVAKLIEKVNEQTAKHITLLNEIAEKKKDFDWEKPLEKIQDTVITVAEKDENIKQHAEGQIKRAETAIHELESESAKLKSGFIYSSQTQSSKFAINEQGVPNNKKAINTKGTGAVARIVCDPIDEPTCKGQATASCDFGTGNWHCPYGITTGAGSTTTGIAIGDPGVNGNRMKVSNLGNRGAAVEEVFVGDFTGDGRADVAIHDRQTGDWFIGRSTGSVFTIEAWAGSDTAGGMLTNARAHLTLAKADFKEGKFGEAFGQARSAEVLAKNGLRIISNIIREGIDADTPRIEDKNSAMPIVPGAGK